jgi:RNA polymerase-binding protein DksA
MARTTRSLADRTVAAAKRVTRKASGAKSSAAEPAAKKPAAKKTPAKTTATKAVAKKAPAKKAAAKKATVAKAPAKKPVAKAPAKSAAKKAPAKKTPTKKAPVTTAKKSTQSTARSLTVKADEKPWTTAELDEVRGELNADRERLRSELNMAEHELHDLMRDAGDGAGNDQADVGSTTFERDHEMSLANNARDMLSQTEHALARIEDGTYGVCERCGEPIGKMRLMAFPRATLCLSCKQREERR